MDSLRRWGIEGMEPFRIAADLAGLEGKWVAIKEDEVVAVGDTPDAVYMRLHSRRVRDAIILRVPTENEPELVGIG